MHYFHSLQARLHTFRQWVVTDWRTCKYFLWGILLLILTIIPTLFYYLNYPGPELSADTPTYLNVANRLLAHPYLLVDILRLPGYPLLIALTYGIAGKNNLMAVSVVQAILFVLTTLEIYVLAILLFKRAWIALFIGLLIGTNLVILSYVKPIMSEGLAMWELTTLALAIVYFIRTTRRFRYVVLCLLLLMFTRPEWMYLPLPLFAYLLLIARHKGYVRPLLKKAAIASAFLYALVGCYIVSNALFNHYPGLTSVENLNWLGKVLQYNMWQQAPPEAQHISQQLDYYVVKIDKDPYHLLGHIPELMQDNRLAAGRFAMSIILRHPIEFLLKSVPYFFASLTSYFDATRPNIPGPYDIPLSWLKSIHRWLYNINILFPFCAAFWSLLLFWRGFKARQTVQEMGAIVLLALYGLITTTLAGYRLDDYMRFHTVFDPLLILVIWGSILICLQWLITRALRIVRAKYVMNYNEMPPTM